MLDLNPDDFFFSSDCGEKAQTLFQKGPHKGWRTGHRNAFEWKIILPYHFAYFYLWWAEPALPIGINDYSWAGITRRSPVPALQFKPSWSAQFESAAASALHIPPFGFNPGDARDKSLISRGVVTILQVSRRSIYCPAQAYQTCSTG